MAYTDCGGGTCTNIGSQCDACADQGETVKYRGILAEHSAGEADDILYLDSADERSVISDPVASLIADDIERYGSYLSVRYWTAAQPQDDDAMIEGALREMLGAGEAEYGHRYSEITGYLWTDEELSVGGHDLLEELRQQKGRYCLLEIIYHK